VSGFNCTLLRQLDMGGMETNKKANPIICTFEFLLTTSNQVIDKEKVDPSSRCKDHGTTNLFFFLWGEGDFTSDNFILDLA